MDTPPAEPLERRALSRLLPTVFVASQAMPDAVDLVPPNTATEEE
jgi:hypothetical protein